MSSVGITFTTANEYTWNTCTFSMAKINQHGLSSCSWISSCIWVPVSCTIVFLCKPTGADMTAHGLWSMPSQWPQPVICPWDIMLICLKGSDGNVPLHKHGSIQHYTFKQTSGISSAFLSYTSSCSKNSQATFSLWACSNRADTWKNLAFIEHALITHRTQIHKTLQFVCLSLSIDEFREKINFKNCSWNLCCKS